jgi:hypothetical protein
MSTSWPPISRILCSRLSRGSSPCDCRHPSWRSCT